MRTTMLHVRIDEEIKSRATEALAEMGLSMSGAVRVFLTRVANEKALPFAIRVPNATTQAAMNEARAMNRSGFATAQELFDDLEKAGSK